jgi:hypothetical protein
MLSVPAPTPPPPLPPIRTNACLEIKPDEQWKVDVCERIEHSLHGMVEDAQTLRDTIFNSQPSESSRDRANAQYDKSMSEIRTLAQEEFTRQLRLEMSERRWALNVIDSNSPDVARQQQWIFDSIHKAVQEHTPFASPYRTRLAAGVLSSSPQQLGDGVRVSDGGFENHFEEGLGSAGSETTMMTKRRFTTKKNPNPGSRVCHHVWMLLCFIPSSQSPPSPEGVSLRANDICQNELSYSMTTADARSASSLSRRRNALPDVRQP